MALSDSEIVSITRRELDQAQGFDADVLATKREQALNYYHGIMPDAADGRSQLVSKDVADTVHALLSQVSRILQTSIIEFEPNAEDDEDAAQMESDFVRKQIERCGGWQTLNEAAHDALLIGNGWIKVYVDEDKDVTKETYWPGLDAFQIDALYQNVGQNEEIVIKESDDRTTVTRTTTKRELKIKAIAPDVMLFSDSGGQFDLEESRFVAERMLYTGNDLRAMGISQAQIDKIPFAPEDYWPAVNARQGIYQDTQSDAEAPQEAERLRECFDCYLRLDDNDDGTTELHNLLIGGQELLIDEPADCIPYATGSPCPMPHRIQGTGMYELIGAVQESKTSVLRKYVDNLEVMNSSRLAVVDGDVNMEDLTSGRINGVVRMKHPQAVVPLPATDAGQQAITGLNYLDTVRSQRGGQSVDNNEADRQLMQSSAAAATGAIEASERMAGWYSRNIVNTLLADTYKLVHKRMSKEMPGQISVNLRGKWVQTDPGEWQERKHINVLAGMTTSERRERIQGLTETITALNQMIMQGGEGIITNKQKLYSAYDDWLAATEVGDAEQYLIDPASEESQQVQQQQQQAAQQQEAQMMQMQQQMAAMQKEIEDNKVAYDYYKTDQELKWKYFDTRADNEVAEAKMTLDTIKAVNDNETRARDSKEGAGQGTDKDAA